MLTVIALTVIAILVAGAAIKFYFDLVVRDRYLEINTFEFVLGSLLIAAVLVPSTVAVGYSIAKSNAVSYNEFWSGLEKQAWTETKTCHRDGSCEHHHNCDPYTVMVAHTRTDSKGNTSTYYTTETHYHQCPDYPNETAFYVKDSMGERYTFGHGVYPRDREPGLWVQAKDRIDSGNPGGTAQRHKYDNLILASQSDIYAKASGAISTYLKKGWLPKVTDRVHGIYLTDHLYEPTGDIAGLGQVAVRRLNGKVGQDKHGDLSLVAVDTAKIPDADVYAQALEAYWGSAALGKNALSKNGVVIVVGVNALGTVDWARAFTGMPVGNEGFAVAVRDGLTGKRVAEVVPTIQALVYDPINGFKRTEMKNFRYLFGEIQPSGTAKFWTAFVAFLLSLFVWAFMLTGDIRVPASLAGLITIKEKK